MPILDVEIVLKPGEVIVVGTAREIADAAAESFGAGPGSTWVKMRGIDPAHYAENGTDPSGTAYPVFISILKSKLPPPDDLRHEVERLAPALAAICNRPPENVHLIYFPDGTGRVAF